MTSRWPFDRPSVLALTEARQKSLVRFINDLAQTHTVSSVVDVGCGIGDFTRLLCERGLKVMGIDGREENVEEAKRRSPHIRFHAQNIEDPSIQNLGSFDLVVCPGLVYHLENPFQAIRNLAALTQNCLWLESMTISDGRTVALLVDEGKALDQGLNHIAFVPSVPCLIKMLSKAGFNWIYQETRLLDHKDFHSSLLYRPRRTVLVASRSELKIPGLILKREPHSNKKNIYRFRWPSVVRFLKPRA